MTSICAWCPGCLAALGQEVDGFCSSHRCEIRAEVPAVDFICRHDHEKTREPYPTNRAARRRKRRK